MGRRRWQHYQQLLMENVHLKDEDKQMEEKDWESSEKCNFCDESSNTSQQTVDNNIPECQKKSKTKNHSIKSSYETENSEEKDIVRKNNLDFQGSQYKPADIPERTNLTTVKLNSMSRLDSVASSVAASMAAVAAINNISLPKTFGDLRFPAAVSAEMVSQWYLPQANFKMETEEKHEEQEADATDDQPLDLSAKSCSPLNSPIQSPTVEPSPVFASHNLSSNTFSTSHSLKVPVYNSNRHIFKAKPRLNPMGGRRTYTEEELQAALSDIQSGKLGTRKAALIYGIPRSTLRNKVCKLAKEKECNNSVSLSLLMGKVQSEVDMDILSHSKEDLEEGEIENGEEEEEDEEEKEEEEDDDIVKELSPSKEDKVAKSFAKPIFTTEDLLRLSHSSMSTTENDSLEALIQNQRKFQSEQVIKHQQDKDLLTPPKIQIPQYSIFPPGASEIWGNLDAASIAPYLTYLIAATRETSLLGHPNPYSNVRGQNSVDEHSRDVATVVAAAAAVSSFNQKFSAPLFPEMMQKILVEESEDRKNLFRVTESSSLFSSSPVDANQEEISTNSNLLHRLSFLKSAYKNGSTSAETYCNVTDYSATSNRVSEGSEKSATSSPPPLPILCNKSSSPLPANNKIINLRDAITKTVAPPYHFQHQQQDLCHTSASSSHESLHRLSFPSSVIKSHSQAGVVNDEQKRLSTMQASCSTTSGKGTRPKRGKYRNYDRDSLVEAVRAVQRGEMSVHRAGSFYGVPHSTLEYKVKERHLMRPRKRELKNQLGELKRQEDGSVLPLSVVSDKSAATQLSSSPQPNTSKSPFTSPLSLPTTSNSLNIAGLFDVAAAHPFATPSPFPFWPAPFPQLVDYSRGSAATAAAFSSNPENLLVSHLAQRIQEETKSKQTSLAALGKNAREMAESLYEGSGANGSFLDGVIRSSLDTEQVFGGDSLQKNNFLEQLYKNKNLVQPNHHQMVSGGSGIAGANESDEEMVKPNVNHALAQALQVAASTETTSNDESQAKESFEMVEENSKAHEHDQDFSLQKESQSVHMKIKTEKN